MATQMDATHASLVPAEEGGGTDSPSKRNAEEDPEAELNRLLAKRRTDTDDAPPAWAASLIGLQQGMNAQLASLGRDVHSFHGRLEKLESSIAPQRIEAMQEQINQLQSTISRLTNQPQARASPSSRSGAADSRGQDYTRVPPPQPAADTGTSGLSSQQDVGSHTDDTDFNHIIVGGWPEDSKRKLVETETWAIVKRFEASVLVESVLVYGSRAHISHIYLAPLPLLQAKQRFYRLQEKHSKVVESKANGNLLWLSPKRTAARRAQNRGIRQVLGRLQSVLCIDDPELLESEEGRELIWYNDRRIAAPSLESLRAKQADKIVCIAISDGDERRHYYVNASVVATVAGKDLGQIEAALQTG